jgi:hypothetical protein
MTMPFGPPPFAQKPSIVDRVLGRLFPTAQYAGLLDPEQQQGLQRQGLLNVGLNLLQAGGRSAHQAGTLANIGASIQGVNFPEMAQQALQLKAYQQQQGEQQAVAAAVARHPIKAGESPYDRLTGIMTEIATIPGAVGIAEKMAPILAALKPSDRQAREPIRIPDVRDNRIGSPTHGLIGTKLLSPDSPYTQVGFEPQVQASEQAPKPTKQQGDAAEFGAQAIAAWRPLDQIRRAHPGVEEEVGRILTSPKFAEAVPGFRSSQDAVRAIANGGGSKEAQQYMRARWSFIDAIARVRYQGSRLSGPVFAMLQNELMPGLDTEANGQMKTNEIQNMLTAQGEAGYDLNPDLWNRATKRHGVSNIDLQSLLSGGGGDSNLNAIQNRYPPR